MAKPNAVAVPTVAPAAVPNHNTPHSATVFTLSKKGATARPNVGNLNNAASWAGVQAALAANGGTATGQQICQAIAAANPANVGNAVGYLNYLLPHKLNWLQPVGK